MTQPKGTLGYGVPRGLKVKFLPNKRKVFPSSDEVKYIQLPAIPTIETAGAYTLVIQLKRRCDLSIGRLGIHPFAPGYYVYLGSALGCGGVRARVQRHLRCTTTKPTHWHVDCLLAAGKIVEVWWKPGKEKLECLWAARLRKIGSIHVPRFGASDCRCPGHLVRFEDQNSVSSAFHLLGNDLQRHEIAVPRALSPYE